MSVRAVVQVTLELEVDDSWSNDTTASQILRQARESAIQHLRQGVAIFNLQSGLNTHKCVNAKILGEPKVTMVIAEGTSRP
jgi:hypothetical protein